MNEVLSRFGLSARRFCQLSGWNRSSLHYRPEGRGDAALRERLRSWAARKPRWGAPILHDVLKAEGLVINRAPLSRGRTLPAAQAPPETTCGGPPATLNASRTQ